MCLRKMAGLYRQTAWQDSTDTWRVSEKQAEAHPTIRETVYIQELLDAMKASYKSEKKIYLE